MHLNQGKTDLSSTRKYKIVKERIKEERNKRGIKENDLGYGSRKEPSCTAYGESYTFVEFQLMRNKEDCKETWGRMRESQIELDMAFDYLFFGKRF